MISKPFSTVAEVRAASGRVMLGPAVLGLMALGLAAGAMAPAAAPASTPIAMGTPKIVCPLILPAPCRPLPVGPGHPLPVASPSSTIWE